MHNYMSFESAGKEIQPDVGAKILNYGSQIIQSFIRPLHPFIQ